MSSVLGQFGLGLILLYLGAEWLVRGAAALGMKLGLTPLIVGLTVVAFGTSVPELIVSLNAGFAGQGPLAIGNVVGSNIANITLILGIAALVRPLRVQVQLIRLEVPVMIAVSAVLLLMLRDGVAGRIDGLLLAAGLVAYVGYGVRLARRERDPAVQAEFGEALQQPPRPLWAYGLQVAGGLILLLAGADLLVRGGTGIARTAGLSEAVIGLTVIAVGTSLPELATSTVAAWKRKGDIAVGNVIGSNLFNILAVLGVAAAATPLAAGGISQIDLLVMLGVAVIALPILRTGFVISRAEGVLLLLIYVGYIGWLAVNA